MKEFNLLLIISALLAIAGCTTPDSKEVVDSPISHYNVVVILDGTDRLMAENVVPVVSREELKDMASKMLSKGVGTLYVTYVDSNSDNNPAAILDFDGVAPEKIGVRPSYVPVAEWRPKDEKFHNDSIVYENNKKLVLETFEKDVAQIVEQAYSDKIASNKRGSDVNGAINQAYRLLKPNMSPDIKNIIILISDGVDNVGKELSPKEEYVELYLVNGTVSKHLLGDNVDNEFVTLNQVIKHIFK